MVIRTDHYKAAYLYFNVEGIAYERSIAGPFPEILFENIHFLHYLRSCIYKNKEFTRATSTSNTISLSDMFKSPDTGLTLNPTSQPLIFVLFDQFMIITSGTVGTCTMKPVHR